MFDQTFVDTNTPARKPWTVAASLSLQTAAVAALLIVPLLHVEALRPRIETPVFMPLHVAPLPPATAVTQMRNAVSPTRPTVFRLPTQAPASIPRQIDMTPDAPLPAGAMLIGALTGPVLTDAFPGLLSGNPTIEKPTPKPAVEMKREPPKPTAPVKVGGSVQASRLISGPKPVYPPLAKAARVQGSVRLQAIISRDGTIERLQVISGPPLLVKAAMDAVQQWRYQPTLLNNQPVEVSTEIEVNFTLNGN